MVGVCGSDKLGNPKERAGGRNGFVNMVMSVANVCVVRNRNGVDDVVGKSAGKDLMMDKERKIMEETTQEGATLRLLIIL